MPPSPNHVPTYRLHKPTGQALVQIQKRRIYLGKYNSPESRAEYDRVVGEYLAARKKPESVLPAIQKMRVGGISVSHVCLAFWEHAQTYYRSTTGHLSNEVDAYRQAMRPLRKLFGDLPAVEFGPLKLRAVRDEMIAMGWVRTNINRQVGRIVHIFRWATSQELAPAEVYQALESLDGLRQGRSEAPEGRKVKPVEDARVAAVLPWLSEEVGDMIRLQRIAGLRPQDVTQLRGSEIDMVGEVWVYKPSQHKTGYLGHERVIHFGPAARTILEKWLGRVCDGGHLFSPARAEEARREAEARRRKTPAKAGNRRGYTAATRAGRHVRVLGNCYSVAAYRKAIERACARAFIAPEGMAGKELAAFRKRNRWHPNQLRHTAGTEIRRMYDAETARVVLGHRHLKTTEIYAEVDHARAAAVMGEVG